MQLTIDLPCQFVKGFRLSADGSGEEHPEICGEVSGHETIVVTANDSFDFVVALCPEHYGEAARALS